MVDINEVIAALGASRAPSIDVLVTVRNSDAFVNGGLAGWFPRTIIHRIDVAAGAATIQDLERLARCIEVTSIELDGSMSCITEPDAR